MDGESKRERGQNNFGFLRLVFATLVILSHSPEMLDGNRSREILTNMFGSLSFGEVAVDGFFLLSGFLITKSFVHSKSSLEYVVKRILRIYPGYIVAYILSVLVFGVFAGGDVGSLFDLAKVKDSFVTMAMLGVPVLEGAFSGLHHPALNASMWTITFEFQCYLLVVVLGSLGILRRPLLYSLMTVLAILSVVGNKFGILTAPDITAIKYHLAMVRPVDVLFYAGALCIVLGILGIMRPSRLWCVPALLALVMIIDYDMGSIDTVSQVNFTRLLALELRFTAIFLCGGAFYLLHERIAYTPRGVVVAALSLTALLFVQELAEAALAVLGGYLIFWFALRCKSRVLGGIGGTVDVSYGVYLYAWPVQNSIILRYPDISPWLLFGVATLIAALLGYCSWMLVESPFLRLKGVVPRLAEIAGGAARARLLRRG